MISECGPLLLGYRMRSTIDNGKRRVRNRTGQFGVVIDEPGIEYPVENIPKPHYEIVAATVSGDPICKTRVVPTRVHGRCSRRF